MQAASPPPEPLDAAGKDAPGTETAGTQATGSAASGRSDDVGPARPRAQQTLARARPVTPPVRNTAGHLALLLAVLALLLSGWVGYRQWQQAQQADSVVAPPDLSQSEGFRELERRLNQSQQRLAALEARQRDDQAVNEVMREQLLSLSQRLTLSEQAVTDVARQSQPQGPQLELLEAEYLLQAAETRLQLFSDLEGSRNAMRLADRVLAGSGDPLASAVRGTLAAELDALAALPRIDAAAVQSRLAALFADLDRWPLRDGAEPAAEPTGESPPWYRAWLRLDNYLSIRRVAPEEGLDPFLEGSARLALRAQIALARLLLLQHRHDEIPALLAGARRSLAAFDPDHPGVARAAQGLDDLAREPFNQPLPQIGLALDELRRLRGLRVLANPTGAPAAMPDATSDDAVGPAEDQQP